MITRLELTPEQRAVLIDALDQYVTNTSEEDDLRGEVGDSYTTSVARELLEKLQAERVALAEVTRE